MRRVHVPKGGSKTETRPIGVPTLEDKVLQRAVAMLLEPIYEQDFYDCSQGFRPGRGAHQALEALWKQTMVNRGGWVVEVDIRKVRGHFAYYGITGNSTSLSRFRTAVVNCWRKWLSRRNRQRSATWDVFHRLQERYPLPPVRVLHSIYLRAKA